MSDIVNITPENFGGPMRNGDLIALCNFVEGWRTDSEKHIQVNVPDYAIQPQSYVIQMRDWLVDNTDYFTKEQASHGCILHNANLWDLRCRMGDVVRIEPKLEQKKKIVIVPVFDAPYNTYRNWTLQMLDGICEHYSSSDYNEYEKIILTDKPVSCNIHKFTESYNFLDNLKHIQECTIYVGGDTGLSHFVGALTGPRHINYFYGSHGLVHTNPFYSGQGGGYLNQFIGTDYNLKNL